MQFTDDQSAAAHLAALEHSAERGHLLTNDESTALVAAILTAIPDPTVPHLSAETLAGMSDVYRGLIEVASGVRAQAVAAGFEPEMAQMMAAGTFNAMMIGATGA